MTAAGIVGRPRIFPERASRIFGNPRPPAKVWEKQFDGFDRELRKLARKSYDLFEDRDFWYYFNDLAYIELQQDLFNYLFPVCLDYWYRSLMQNESCDQGDADFHSALLRGRILERMVKPPRREAIFDFFEDGLLDRIDQERGFIYSGSRTPAKGWMGRFNSFGLVAPRVQQLWTRWWDLASCGQAVAALQYASGLMYFKDENPLFGPWTQTDGGGGPYLLENDSSAFDHGWMEENTTFLREGLTIDYLAGKIKLAALKLMGEPEEEKAALLLNDFEERRIIVESRIGELPDLLSRAPQYGVYDWTV